MVADSLLKRYVHTTHCNKFTNSLIILILHRANKFVRHSFHILYNVKLFRVSHLERNINQTFLEGKSFKIRVQEFSNLPRERCYTNQTL